MTRRYRPTATLLCVFTTLVGCGGGTNSSAPELPPAAVATAVGPPIAGAVAASATIGAAGGELLSSDGRLTINVPAAALTQDVVVGIAPISNPAQGGMGNGYRLTPNGQTFQKPVDVIFAYTDEEVAASGPELLDVAFQRADGYWQLADTLTLDTTAKTLTATTTHFTDWSLIARYRLSPGSATVKVKSGAQVFNIEWCIPARGNTAGSGAPLLAFNWTPISVTRASLVASNWSVNGVSGGNGTYGTIHPDVERGGYAAPDTKPKPSTVAVSVDVTNWPTTPSLKGKLVSNVAITDQPSEYTGSFNLTTGQTGVYTIVGSGSNVVWSLIEDTGDVRKYQMTSGTISATINYENCAPVTVSVPASAANVLDVYTSTNAAFPMRYGFGVIDPGAAGGGSDTVSLQCGGVAQQIPVSIISFPVTTCYLVSPLGSDLPAFAVEELLEESSYRFNCGALPWVSGSWSFIQQ